jgi:hypothetical protein
MYIEKSANFYKAFRYEIPKIMASQFDGKVGSHPRFPVCLNFVDMETPVDKSSSSRKKEAYVWSCSIEKKHTWGGTHANDKTKGKGWSERIVKSTFTYCNAPKISFD